MKISSVGLFFFCISLFFQFTSDCRADSDILHSTLPIVAVYSRPSSVKFASRQNSQKQLPTVYRFSLPLPVGAGMFDEKPLCEKSQVRRKRVVYDSGKLNFFDMLIYDYRDSVQSAKARDWELPTVPYMEGALVNPYQIPSPQQYWARFFDIQCLPTRLHYQMSNGVRYEEYREGERAFDYEF